MWWNEIVNRKGTIRTPKIVWIIIMNTNAHHLTE